MAIEKQLVDSLALAEYDEYVKRALEGKANKKDLEGIPSAEEYLAFEQTVSQSLTDISERINNFDESKVDKSDLEALQTAIDGKADQADLEALETVVNGKADKTDLDAKASIMQLEEVERQVLTLETTISQNSTDVNERINNLYETKADVADLLGLDSVKADKSDLTALEERVTALEESGGGSSSSESLEGTSWTFNSGPDVSTEFSYDIEVEFEDDGETYTRTSMSVGYVDAAGAYGLFLGSEPVCVDGYGWVTSDGTPLTIKITGGSDVNNSELKAYLAANATQNTVEYATKEDLESLSSNMGMMGNDLQGQINDMGSFLSTINPNPSLFRMISRQSFSTATGGYVDLYSYLQTYNELLVVLRFETTQSTYLGFSTSTAYSNTGNVAYVLPGTGTKYLQVRINKTDEGNFAVLLGTSNFSWATSSNYRYLKYWPSSSSNPGTTAVTFVIHGRM